MNTTSTLPESLKALIRDSNLAYVATSLDRLVPYTLKTAIRAQLHDNCLLTSINIPAGTAGWMLVNDVIAYSAYVWVGDEQYPAKDATSEVVARHYTWVAEVGGKLVDHYAFRDLKDSSRNLNIA